MAKPFLTWIGGKEKLASLIKQVFPPNPKQYVEVFGGSGAILLSLPPSRKRLDIYNDYNADLVNLFVCAKTRTLALLKELNFLPLHSRAEFEYLKNFLRHEPEWTEYQSREMEIAVECFPPEQAAELLEILCGRAKLYDVERAAAYFRVCRGSFSGTTTSFGVKVCDIASFLYLFCAASVRLRNVVIENKDGAEMVNERNDPDTLVYCDPPYYEAEKSYTMLFTKGAHRRLFHAAHKSPSYVVISYNDCPYIRNLYKDFYIQSFERNNPLAQTKGAKYHELIITNYNPSTFMARQLTMFDESNKNEVGAVHLIHIPKYDLREENIKHEREKRKNRNNDAALC